MCCSIKDYYFPIPACNKAQANKKQDDKENNDENNRGNKYNKKNCKE